MSHYVCQWWVQQFPDITIEKNSNTAVQFNKKHRDQVRWNNGKLPFRRSGLWMTIKVVLQMILTKRLGNVGTVIYKLLITQFLMHIIHTRQSSKFPPISMDLLIYCMRKIIRRMNKIDNLLSVIDSNDAKLWIEFTKGQIYRRIDEIFPKMDWQASIRRDEEGKHQHLLIDSNLNNDEIYRHRFEALKKYIISNDLKRANQVSCNIENDTDDSINNEATFHIPSFHVLTNRYNCTVGTALTRMEIAIISWLKQWISQGPIAQRETERFQMLSEIFNDYQKHALQHYCPKNSPVDSIGYSRFILTSLTIIRTMHEKLCQDTRFERLNLHRIFSSPILDLFEFLVLPNRDNMVQARQLYDYFNRFIHLSNPDILTDIDTETSFGVYFAAHSTKMNNILRKIQAQVEKDKIAKIQEVRNAKDKYNRLMNSVSGCPCTCYDELNDRQCRRCRIEQTANNIEVNIYECPVPSKESSALAVMFELRMPVEMRCYRDVLWQFENRSQRQFPYRLYEWLRILPHSCKLEPHFTGPNNYQVKLVSSTNSITQHLKSSPPIATASIEDFLCENSLQVAISPVQLLEFYVECQMLTPRLNHSDYKHLQYTIESTRFIQNHIIADLSHVQTKLKPRQFIEFGSFRSGHRLQWWNLLTILESDSLSLNEESVAILITHTILQYGPMTENLNLLISSWCSESHQQLLDDDFIDELVSRLNHHLDDCSSNWQNELVLVVITMITMRILSICNSTREEKVTNLALKCRRIGEKWIDMISARIQKISPLNIEQVENLRLNIFIIGIACIFTFATHADRVHRILSLNAHLISLLKAATNVHDNTISNKKPIYTSIFLRDMIRLSEHVLIHVQPIVEELLQKSSYKSLNDFSTIYWATIRHDYTVDGQWKKRHKNIYDGWYDGKYESTSLSIDCVHGIFLVNGMCVGYLPEKIISNELYIRVFDKYIFPVQLTDSSNTYITKYSYHNDEQVQYEFYFNDQLNRLIVYERHGKTNDIFELIPPTYFETELSVKFVSEYSHWKNKRTQTIEFRPIHFHRSRFFEL